MAKNFSALLSTQKPANPGARFVCVAGLGHGPVQGLAGLPSEPRRLPFLSTIIPFRALSDGTFESPLGEPCAWRIASKSPKRKVRSLRIGPPADAPNWLRL